MKKLLIALLLFVSVAYGQDKTVVPTAPPAWATEVESLASSIFAARAASLAIYPSYDPYITVGGVKHPYGFGASLLYPVSEYAFAGARLDFLGNSFWAPSAVVGAKYTLKNLPTTPTVFTTAGLILPLSGAGSQNQVAGATTGLGATFMLYHNRDSTFTVNGFISAEKWTEFKGVIVHPGIAGAIKF